VTTPEESDRPKRIVIVGAGPSGLSTAFHLTDPDINPNWRDHYEVDVYQMGWRAGGKGATGRNADACERIEEHGIHVFGNFYFNAVRMLQSAFAEIDWDDGDKYRTMDEVFLPSNTSSETEYVDGRWQHSVGVLMNSPGNPWTGPVDLDERDIVGRILENMDRILAAMMATKHGGDPSLFDRIMGIFRRLAGDELERWADRIEQYLDEHNRDPVPPNKARHSEMVDQLAELARVLGALHLELPHSTPLRDGYIEADLIVAVLRGLVDDDVATRGIDAIDGENYRDWLARHGASQTTLKSGRPQALPNTALGYECGDTTAIPTMSATAYVNFFCRWVIGHGPGGLFFREGTGDTLIKPLYRLLVQRGVRFHYFHKLSDVVPDADPDDRSVARLVFDVQATPLGGTYDPLRRLDDGGLVWPNRPLYDQLAEGVALQEGTELHGRGYDLESWWTAWQPVGSLTLEAGRDFDQVVLATPISTLEHTCSGLIERSDDWQRMVANVKSAATQAVQIWIDRPTGEIGWDQLQGTDRYLGGIFAQDLTSYCDFSDLIAEERWPEANRPKGLIYLIGALSDPDRIPPFDDHDFPRREEDRVRWMTVQFLRTIDGLLPNASHSPIDPRSFDFGMLVSPQPSDPPSRGVNQFAQQYWRANVDPNERYTLNVAGSMQHRLEAWGSTFDNLVLTGDWIYTGWNVGSFEGAVMSGKLASLTLTGAPGLDQVWGYSFLQASRPAPPPPRLDLTATT